MIPRLVTEIENKWEAKWLHNMGMEQNVKTYVFGKDKVLCHERRYESQDPGIYTENRELLPGSLPIIFKYKIFTHIYIWMAHKVITCGTSLK